jgi:hypothetical protein
VSGGGMAELATYARFVTYCMYIPPLTCRVVPVM